MISKWLKHIAIVLNHDFCKIIKIHKIRYSANNQGNLVNLAEIVVQDKSNSIGRRLLKYFIYFIFLIIIGIILRISVGEPCKVSSNSMEPTIMPGSWLWIDKLSYGGRLPERWADIPLVNAFTHIRSLREADVRTNWGYRRLPGFTRPKRGDIVVFSNPENDETLLVKRLDNIIPKGTVYILSEQNYVLANEIAQKDGYYIYHDGKRYFIDGKESASYVVAQNYYYFLGDNRDVSKDSRFFGYVPERMIVGKIR